MKTMKDILLCAALAAIAGCTNFAQPFGNIEPDVKTRPLAVTLNPCDAAPGDTVTVTAYVYTPEPSVSFSWSAKMDHFETGYGFNSVSPRSVDLSDYEIPGSMTTSAPDVHGLVTHTFRFTVPDDALAASQLVDDSVDVTPYPADMKTLLGIPAGAALLPNAVFDSLLRANAFDLALLGGTVPPELELAIDMYATGMLLEATISCEIGLVLERTLAVSYSRSYGTGNFNSVPVIGDISVLIMDEDEEVTNLDDLTGTAYDSILLFSAANPVAEPETVLIDEEKKYYLAYTHDQKQTFHYLSVDDGALSTAEEWYDNDWCYTNIDPSNQVQDSLMIVSGNRLIPPRDTDMHHFRLYLMVHDYRSEWGALQGVGTAFAEVYGYFMYTDAYKAKHR